MNKTVVLFVYHSLNSGGAEKEMLAYIRSLPDEKYEIHLALTRITGELLPELPKHILLHEAPGNSIRPDFRHLYSLYSVIRLVRPAVVIGFMQDINFNILFLRHAFGLRYKTIASEQIVLSQWQRLMKTGRLKSLLVSHLYRNASVIAAQSESIRDDLIASFAIDRSTVRVIPSFIDPSAYPFRHRRRSHSYFVYMGRLAPEKNIGLLLEAFRSTWKQHRTARLKLVGTGPSEVYKSLIRSLGIEKAVSIAPFTSHPEKYYAEASALIIPSPVEGRSRVMIEAMLSGCPVISSDFIGHDRYIRHNDTGLVFNRNSAEELSNALLLALTRQQSMNVIARRAHTYITKIYSDTYNRKYSQLINRMFRDVLGK